MKMKKITQMELNEILELHKIWRNSSYTAGVKADLSSADLTAADLTGAIQLLYHMLSIIQNSNNVCEELKQTLLTESNVKTTNAFHQVGHYEVKPLTVKKL